jgi:uncharacterized protein
MKEDLIPMLWNLRQMSCRRGLTIGIDDYKDLQQSLRAGFGWNSRQEFFDLCTSLWAKSVREQEILTQLFDQLFPVDLWSYSLPEEILPSSVETPSEPTPFISEIQPDPKVKNSSLEEPKQQEIEIEIEIEIELAPKIQSQSSLPSISFEGIDLSERRFIFVPQFPLSYREIAQTWRRLRRRISIGTATELDIQATIDLRVRRGIATNLVLRPRQRNVARLLLLVDRQGSMAPFHGFCDEVCKAITEASRLGETDIYYFHNLPAEGADDEVLESLSGQFFPILDPILRKIKPLSDGCIYTDRDLLEPILLKDVLEKYARDSSVVIISDAGCARNGYRVSRLLDTIAFMKAIRTYTPHYVWLNPLADRYWLNINNTARQIARHIPMFPLDREGMERSVSVLRGQEYTIEKSI